MNIDKSVKKYLSKIGKRGGEKSKRILTTEQAKNMVVAREKNKAKKLNKISV
jgi:hypothetical protein